MHVRSGLTAFSAMILAAAVSVPLQGVSQASAPASSTASAATAAAPKDNERTDPSIHLKNRTIGPKAQIDKALIKEIKAGSKARHAIVQLQTLPHAGADDLGELASLGVTPVAHLGGISGSSTAYLASIQPGVKADSAAWSRLVRSVVRINDSDKIDPAVRGAIQRVVSTKRI